MTRVLVVSHYFAGHGGGVEVIAGELAARLATRGLAVTWAASGPAEGPPPARVTLLPMRAWDWTAERLGVPYPVWGPGDNVRLARAVRGCDVVHLHDCLYAGNVAAALFARAASKPVLVTQHIGLVPYRSRVLRGLMGLANHTLGRRVLTSAARCVVYSPQVLSYFSDFVRFPVPPALVPNGVADQFRPPSEGERPRLREQLGWPTDRPVFLFVGRFVEKKGLPLVRHLAQQFPDVVWALAGRGPLDPSAWGLPNVRCLGARTHAELVSLYQSADLLVLPSVGEGFPLVVQEAMACGTPALITTETVGGYPAVEPLVYLAEPRPEAMTEKVRQILADPAALAARRAAVAAFAREHWDWERCADRYAEIIRGLVMPVGKRLTRFAERRAKS